MTQTEAQNLIQVLKKIMQQGRFLLPNMGSKETLTLQSVFSDKDRFNVIINHRSTIRKDKYTLMLLYGKDKGLLRIDVGGPNHTNPDGEVLPCPHIHLQRKDDGKWDVWASSIPAVFGNVEDKVETFTTFLQYCNVNNVSCIEICEQKEMER